MFHHLSEYELNGLQFYLFFQILGERPVGFILISRGIDEIAGVGHEQYFTT